MEYAQAIANQTGLSVSANTDLTGLTVTWTADPTKRYRTTAYGTISHPTVANTFAVISVINGAATATYQSARVMLPLAGIGASYSMTVVEAAGLTGSQTRKLNVTGQTAAGGTLTHLAAATGPAYILVEDIT